MEPSNEAVPAMKTQIMIITGGWVFVGQVLPVVDGWLHAVNVKNLCKWGTSKGLGELYMGPSPSTKLDLCGILHVPVSALIGLIDVDAAAWQPHLTKI